MTFAVTATSPKSFFVGKVGLSSTTPPLRTERGHGRYFTPRFRPADTDRQSVLDVVFLASPGDEGDNRLPDFVGEGRGIDERRSLEDFEVLLVQPDIDLALSHCLTCSCVRGVC
jgi:hypothetical protein